MKKFISLLLVMVMVLSLTACGGNKTEETTENAEVVTNEDTTETEDTNTEVEEQTGEQNEEAEVEGETETEEPVVNETEQEEAETESNTSSSTPQTKPEENTQAPADTEEQKPAEGTEEEVKEEEKEETSSATLGQTLLAVFKDNVGSLSNQELADKLITNEAILFMGGSMPVEQGFLSGFDADITGFKEGVQFGPMMGSIAFVGYVFEVEDGTDVEEFKKTLKSNANPRWQICVEAEETIVESVGNTVFFLMCPRSLEQ